MILLAKVIQEPTKEVGCTFATGNEASMPVTDGLRMCFRYMGLIGFSQCFHGISD